MPAKEFIFEEEARKKLLEGIELLANVLGPTFGPNGLTIGLERSPPKLTSHSSSIASYVELKDQYANMGITLAKEVASKVKELCGDGETLSILLLFGLVDSALKRISAGASPIDVKRTLEKATCDTLDYIEKAATPIQTDADLQKIAKVAANGDEEIALLVYEAIQKVGRDGLISVKEGKGLETKLETVKGMSFEKGYTSAYFSTDNEKQIVEMSDLKVLVTDQKISSIHDILPILQQMSALSRPLLIIADDIEKDVEATLVMNKLKGLLKVCAVKAPGFGDFKKALLEDIAILTGATFVTLDRDLPLKKCGAEVLGNVESATISKQLTTLVTSNEISIKGRLLQIENQIALAQNKYEKERLKERKAKLSSGVAILHVGALIEEEAKQKKERIESSLAAVRASLAKGTVIGGGATLLRAGFANQEKIVQKALELPFKQLVKNAGLEPSLYAQRVLSLPENIGFNAAALEVEDLFAAGIIDPAEVLLSALKCAADCAGMIILSEVLIGDAKE